MPTAKLPPNGGWSLFTVELIAVLPDGKTLRSLEGIVNPAIVQRLAESLMYQDRFTVMNARDLECVVQQYQLGYGVKRHLIAAIMATGVQRILTQRLDNAKQGRAAAYAILPVIETALIEAETAQARGIASSPLTDLKGDRTTMPIIDPKQLALDAIDRGVMALHALEYMPANAPDRLIVAREAYTAFTTALMHLDRADHADPNWSYWHIEAEQGQRRAQEYGGSTLPT